MREWIISLPLSSPCSREFEPDAPNYTPRISGVLHVENQKYSYAMSILKSKLGNLTPACVLPLHMRIRFLEWAISSILICTTAIPFQVLKVSQSL